jgi:SpoVK/Ycf46/Vps4 family AAA+-type ATPase
VKASDRELVTWSSASGLSGNGAGAGTLDEGVRAIAAHTGSAIFAMLDGHRALDDRVAVRRLRDLMHTLGERKQAIVFVGPGRELPEELSREVARVELPLPRHDELRSLFARSIKDADPPALEEAARAALGLTGAEAVRVLRKAHAEEGSLSEAAISRVVQDKGRLLRRSSALALHEPPGGLARVGGLGELKRWLCERRRAFGDEAKQFGLPTPRGLLLLGVQGCGKSLSAKAVAREWQFPLLRLDLAATFGSAQSPEATIRESIAVAESLAPTVLWIDEIEKGFASAAEDPRSSRVFGAFLTWLSEKQTPVFVVATANDISHLPPELLRRGRFDEIFFVDLPTAVERAEIFAIHLHAHGRDPKQFPLIELAEEAERLSGSEIEQVVSSALYQAFAADRDVTENDLMNAITETVPLYDTYEERIKELRDWARTRARAASIDARMVDLFSARPKPDQAATTDAGS